MCIYYKGRTDLTFENREHIISAGIGGINRLPKDYVSTQFNTDSSNLEREFIRNSLISIPRPIVGPGKRGKQSEKYATKSSIVVMENLHNPGEFSLGYLKLGKPYEIPLLLYDETSKFVKFSFDKTDEGNLDEIIGSFIDKLINPEPFKLKILDDERLPLQQILLGHSTEVEDNFNFYLAKHPGNKTQVTPEKLKPFAMALTRTKTDLPQHEQYIPKMSIKMIWKEDHLRVFGKYAFNCLSFLKGKNFVLNERFDGVRGWIANGGHNIYAKMNNEYGEILAKLPVTFPELSHVIHFTKIDRHLVALVSLYETSSVFIDLADNFDSPFEADTWICDWKNRKEYRLMEYLNTLYPGV